VILTIFVAFGGAFYLLYDRLTAIKLRSIEITLDEIKKNPIDYETAKSQERQRTFIEFEDNLRRPLLLKNVQTNGFDMFAEFGWAIQPRINILLGRNGYGKTRLLQAVVAAMTKDEERCVSLFRTGNEKAYFQLELQRTDLRSNEGAGNTESEFIKRRMKSFEQTVGKMPILAIPDSRFINKSRTDVNVIDDDEHDIRENGAYYFLYQKPYEPIIQNFLYQICIDYMKLKTFDQAIFLLVQDIVYKLSGQKFEFHHIEALGQARFSIDVITDGDEKNPIPIQNASQGTLSVLAMFGVIYSYLLELYPAVSDKTLLQQRAIVFIDEIDAHLHPAWQRKVVTLLRETFPNIQFVLTAHSPLVIAGCLDNEVSVLRKNTGKQCTIFQFGHDFIGWEIDQIYRTVFDVEEPDESFQKYSALYADRDRIEKEIEKLIAQSTLSIFDEQILKELRDKLYYIDKTKLVQNQKLDTRDLEIENQRLKMENTRLSRAHSETSRSDLK
jgi:ABC-type cobalamin/Fe3+-siderophores transport system ATPase subunit